MKQLRGYFVEILYGIGLVVLYFVVTWLISL